MRTLKLCIGFLLLFTITSFADTASKESPSRVWIGKPDGTLQCEKKMGISLKRMKKELTVLKVKVYSQKKQSDGKMRIQMCGSATGMLNTFEISVLAFEKAQEKLREKGFERLER
jgi:hypothetical protein